MIGLVLALAALVVAANSAKTATEQRDMQRVEHTAFMAQLNARADLKVILRADHGDQDVIETDAAKLLMRVEIGIDNQGQRAARHVVLNVVASRSIGLRWLDAANKVLPGAVNNTDELLESGGEQAPAHYLSREIENVGLVNHYVYKVRLEIDLPTVRRSEDESADVDVPIRVRVASDDMPEASPEVVVDRTFVIRKR